MRIFQWILALVFAVTAGLKIAAAGSAAMAQTMFGALPQGAQWFVVATELVLALWLVSNWRPRLSAFATITLLSIFLCALFVEITKPTPHSCGCYGTLSSAMKPVVGLWITIGMDVVLIFGAFYVYFRTLSAAPKARASTD